jgi:hypothetical protein
MVFERFIPMRKVKLSKRSWLFFFIISFIFILSEGYGQINVYRIDKNTVSTGKDGVYYSLPRTVIKVNVTVDRIENYKGPYAEYAYKYLGLKNVVGTNSVEYIINNIKVTTSAEPDPDQYYFVEFGDRLSKGEKAGLFSLSESGLFIGTLPEEPDTVREIRIIKAEEPPLISEKDVFPEIFKYSSDASFFEKVDTIIRKVNIDTMTMERQYLKRTVVEKSPEQKAKEAGDFISKIKDHRFNLISGFQEVNYNKETLEYMDSQLKILEKEYMKLFTGISIHKTLVFSFVYTPNPNQVNAEMPVFKYSKTKGIIDLDEPGGKVVTVKLQRSGTTGSLSSYLKKATYDDKKNHGFFYRIPEPAKVTVKLDENLQDETQCLVSQLGVVTYLPVNKWKVSFYKETGGVKGIVVD